MTDYTAIVSGGGPAGLCAAILLHMQGVKTALVTPEIKSDPRTIALMAPSIRMLSYIGIWPGELREKTAPLEQLQIVDDTGNLVQGPRLIFSAREIGEEAFAWNIPLALLIPLLEQRIYELGISLYKNKVTSAIAEDTQITVMLDDEKELSAKVCLAADGASSVLRDAAGIETERWSYAQDALVTTFSHTEPHHFTSIETHKRQGAFTTVPMPGLRSALVWMERPERVAELLAMCDDDLASEIQSAAHGQLGLISEMGPRKSFPMRGLRAKKFAARRTLLIGEASHVFPPIGAQGLNMSLRDAGHAADLIALPDDPGSDSIMQQFNNLRRGDILMRQTAVDLVNSSLLAEKWPFDLGRVLGLNLVRALPPLRNWIMREGLSPSTQLPVAMRN